MRSARQSAIRLLQLMMVASVVLPLVLFAFAARLNYRHEYAVADKLEGFPVYVIAGIDGSAIGGEWVATMASHLVIGLPATLFLLLIIGVALRRTRRLYAEAERREAAEAAVRPAQPLGAVRQITRRRAP